MALAGCTAYHAQPIAPDQLARQFEQRSLVSEALHAYLRQTLGQVATPWPPAQWTREMLTLAAFYYSPALDLSRAQWATAQAGVGVAGAVPNPVLQLPLQYVNPVPGADTPPYTVGFALDIPIETAHKRSYRIAQASHLSEAARLNIENEAWKISAQVRDALIALYAARERITLLSREVAAEQQITQMSRQRLAAGQFSQPEVDAAVLADIQAQSDLEAARSAEQSALASLAKTIGVPVAALDGIDLDLAPFGVVPTAELTGEAQRRAIFRRADLRASLAEYAAAESALQLEVAKQYPDIHLGPGYTYDTGTNKIAFGLAGVSLPIFDRNQGGIRMAEAKRKAAATRTAALQDAILGDLDHALARYRSSRASMRLAQRHRSAARRQLDSQSAAWAAGDADRLTYTQALAAYDASQLHHLDALVAVQRALGALEDVTQQPMVRTPASATVSGQTESPRP